LLVPQVESMNRLMHLPPPPPPGSDMFSFEECVCLHRIHLVSLPYRPIRLEILTKRYVEDLRMIISSSLMTLVNKGVIKQSFVSTDNVSFTVNLLALHQ
jgi:hypothetical protein